jgi:hypothetical protein
MSESTVAARFRVLAEAEPGLLPRLLQPFAKRDLVPDRLRATREGERLRVELALDAVAPEVAALVAGNLRQVVGAIEVEASLSPPALARAA